MLTTLLHLSDLEAVSVADAAALRLIGREHFDLYTIDGGMPNISEATLCERIREVDKGTPIVIFSGRGYQSDIDAGLRGRERLPRQAGHLRVRRRQATARRRKRYPALT